MSIMLWRAFPRAKLLVLVDALCVHSINKCRCVAVRGLGVHIKDAHHHKPRSTDTIKAPADLSGISCRVRARK